MCLSRAILFVLLPVVAVLEIAACLFVNSLMFAPQRCTYDATSKGYVDIGTNGVRIAAVVIGPKRGAKAILRCHGNAEDAANALVVFEEFAARGYTVAAVDYPGYGLSDGQPDEEGCYRNVHRLYDWLVEERGFAPADIIVSGFSIGTGPAVELASVCPVGKLVLEAAYLSAPRIVTRVRLLPIDPFPNLKRITKVKCPVVCLHGTDDRIIPINHGRELFELANEPKRFIEVEGGEHNDLPFVLGSDEYFEAVTAKEFVAK